MNRDELLERLCALCTKVGSEQFHNELPHDCFCGVAGLMRHFERMDEAIVAYIEGAVDERMQREAKEQAKYD